MPADTGDRLIAAPSGRQGVSKIVIDFGKIGTNRQRFLVLLDRIQRSLERCEDVVEIATRFGVIGTQGNR